LAEAEILASPPPGEAIGRCAALQSHSEFQKGDPQHLERAVPERVSTPAPPAAPRRPPCHPRVARGRARSGCGGQSPPPPTRT